MNNLLISTTIFLCLITSCKKDNNIKEKYEIKYHSNGRIITIEKSYTTSVNIDIIQVLTFTKDGSLLWLKNYKRDKNDKKNSLLKVYGKIFNFDILNGYPESIINYKNNLKEGVYRKYNEKTGFLIQKGQYKNDKPVGVWKFYDKNGKFLKSIKY